MQNSRLDQACCRHSLSFAYYAHMLTDSLIEPVIASAGCSAAGSVKRAAYMAQCTVHRLYTHADRHSYHACCCFVPIVFFFFLQDAVLQAQASMLQTWHSVKTACQAMPSPSEGNLTACEQLAEAEAALIEMLQSAAESTVRHVHFCCFISQIRICFAYLHS